MANITYTVIAADAFKERAEKAYANNNFDTAKKLFSLAAEKYREAVELAPDRNAEFSEKARLCESKMQMDGRQRVIDHADKPIPKKTELAPQSQEEMSVEEAFTQLDNLIGLQSVKDNVISWVNQIKVFQMRQERGMKVPDITYHLVLTGNPGTGKTTVARLLAQIYRALGIISQGQLIEVDRAGLVAGYVGQTAIKTQEVIQQAYGGVLFIDEAYMLVKEERSDFGQEALDTLLKEMEDHRNDLVVIVAGYEEPMENFISSNPGLRSRFKTFIHFDDYNGKELFRIFELLCESNEYLMDNEVKQLLQKYFDYVYAHRGVHFGNARDVRNVFEEIVTKQSKRLVSIVNPSYEVMATIIKEDMPENILAWYASIKK